MRALVVGLKKRKQGAANRPREKALMGPTPRQRGRTTPRQRGEATPRQRRQRGETTPRQRGRYVRRAVRRAVWERDGGRCTYVDVTGQRCRETGCLELDHIDPARCGGPPTVSNLRLRCRAHNALAAETAFGREFMARKKAASPLEARPP